MTTEDAIYDYTKPQKIPKISNGYGILYSLIRTIALAPGSTMTSVSCPATILKRQSLLEMYGYLSKPTNDLLVDWSTLDKKERMVRVLRWVLEIQMSYVQEGIQDVKPYNPILGEVFHCHWEHQDGSISTYHAEQVCHHPPITATYMENKTHGITYERTVEPRTTFWGTSTETFVEGENIFTVVDLDEEYIIELPKAYMRNLMLLTSYLEQTGKMTITCKKTGMRAELKFEERNYWGVKGQIYDGDTKVYTVRGNMHKSIDIRDSKTKNTVVLTTHANNLKASHGDMIVKPVAEQEDNESRKVWHKLTKGLVEHKLDVASKEKSAVEEAQRALRKLRPKDWDWNQDWEQVLFRKKGKINAAGVPLFVYKHKLGTAQSEEDLDLA